MAKTFEELVAIAKEMGDLMDKADLDHAEALSCVALLHGSCVAAISATVFKQVEEGRLMILKVEPKPMTDCYP